MPDKYEIIAKEKTIIGEISSTEIRNRIAASKKLLMEKQKGDLVDSNENSEPV